MERLAQRVFAVVLQEIVQEVHVMEPRTRPAVHDLGDVLVRRAAELQQMLALQVALGPLARDCGHGLGAVLRQDRLRSGLAYTRKAESRAVATRWTAVVPDVIVVDRRADAALGAD